MGNKKKNIIKYASLTFALTCVFVVGYFLISNGIIFGSHYSEKPYIEQEYVDDPSKAIKMTDAELTVTPKNNYSHVLTSTDAKIPTIEDTDGNDNMKGSKDNPFYILEIVPDLSQQTLSYLVHSQKEGLPFDPIALGQEYCLETNKSFVDKGNGTLSYMGNDGQMKYENVRMDSWSKKGNTITDLGNLVGGWFNNNNKFSVHDPEGTLTGHPTGPGERSQVGACVGLKSLYKIELHMSAASFVNDYKNLSVRDLANKYSADFVDEDGQPISENALDDDANWAKTFQEDTKNNKTFSISVDTSVIPESDKDLGMAELIAKYPDVFASYTVGTEEKPISDLERSRTDCWKKSFAQSQSIDGYFVCKKNGEGNFNFDGNSIWYVQETQNEVANGNFQYVADAKDLPADAVNFWPDDFPENSRYLLSEYFANAANYADKYYFPVSKLSNIKKLQMRDGSSIVPDSKVKYTFTYSYSGYLFTYEYVGLNFYDILKRSLFDKGSDQEYDDLHIKVAVVTPSMLNKMDENDDPNTLNMVERADMYYVSTYTQGVADENDKVLNFYYDYIDPDRFSNEHKQYDKGSHKVVYDNGKREDVMTFYEDDIEWVDCMKIIKRVSQNCDIPLMFSNQVGDLLDKGVKRNGENTCHLYMPTGWANSQNNCVENIGSLNNVAKLYLCATQFDLSATKGGRSHTYSSSYDSSTTIIRSFMDDIYGQIKKVPIYISNSEKDNCGPNTAKYTGFYKREFLAGCGASQEDKENCYYLWNKWTFLPLDKNSNVFNGVEINRDQLIKYGYLHTYLDNGTVMKNKNGENHKFAGTRDAETDEQNVINPNDNAANLNKVIYNDNIWDEISDDLEEIIGNGSSVNPKVQLQVKKYKKQYVVIDDATSSGEGVVLTDYSREAEYHEHGQHKSSTTDSSKWQVEGLGRKLHVFAEIRNLVTESMFKEDCGIESIKLVQTDEDGETGNSKTVSLEDDEGNAIPKEEVSFSRDTSNADFGPFMGWKFSGNLNLYIPYQLQDWMQGYDRVVIEGKARASKNGGAGSSGKFRPAQKKFKFTIDINERGLFSLE